MRVVPVVLFAFLLAFPVASQDYTPAELYDLACAPCHGEKGEGLGPEHPNYESFDPLPADLTNPLFNSREPQADWVMVTKHGGKRMGLSDQMPAYGEAFSDEQIEQVVGYLKSLADSDRYPPGDLNFPRPVRTIKAFPEDEALVIRRYTDEEPSALKNTLYYARRVGARHQIEVKGSRSSHDGESEEEVELGWKWAFYDDLDRMLLLGGGLEVEIPVDDGTEVWIPYFSLAKGTSAISTFQGTLRAHLPGNDFGAGDVEMSGVAHFAPSPWPRRPIPALEGVVTLPFESEEDLKASLIPQVLIGLTKGGHVALDVGVEVPLTGIDWDYRVHAFLLWDIADGMFWKGW